MHVASLQHQIHTVWLCMLLDVSWALCGATKSQITLSGAACHGVHLTAHDA